MVRSTVVAGVLAADDADPATWRMFLTPSEGGPPELYELLSQARGNVRRPDDRDSRCRVQSAGPRC